MPDPFGDDWCYLLTAVCPPTTPTVTVPCCPDPVPRDLVASFDSACACLDGAEVPLTYFGSFSVPNGRPTGTGVDTFYEWTPVTLAPHDDGTAAVSDTVVCGPPPPPFIGIEFDGEYLAIVLYCIDHGDGTHDWYVIIDIYTWSSEFGGRWRLCVQLQGIIGGENLVTSNCSPFELEYSSTVGTTLGSTCSAAVVACRGKAWTCTFLPA